MESYKKEEEEIKYLRDFFREQCRTTWYPDNNTLRYALALNDVGGIRKAIILASGQCVSGEEKDKWHYACGIMRNWKKEREKPCQDVG